ncbi:T9SS type A sorting domain-containing protein [Flavivirga algicola]|uniref:T9SS type A sorting domain-containing protein n=1 Tax=Flavivirga algicola TaxID=2729136 RepID=A0ABX1S3H4_9FLAO|nr:T9SS type A sorting domain-containing protein [Flavivirga algicola]NMH88984.1 T9SS type A sorting domain-containing protein [Flavivirga algicola]
MYKISTKEYSFLITCLFVVSFLFANNPNIENTCNCDYVVTPESTAYNASAVNPGEKICIEGGHRKELRFDNVNGTKDNPIIISNCDTRVIIESQANYGILFTKSKHFHLSGTGANDTYGIYIKRTNLMGINVTGLSSHFEINNIEISNTGFAGIIAKTDPSCENKDLRSFVMEEVLLHDNYIHDVEGEGIYIGYSWYPSREVTCSGTTTTFYPHSVQNVDIHHNTITHTGWDGLQIGSGVANIKVHHNQIDMYGLEKRSAQDNGMQIGAGTTGDWYNNKITNGQGIGGNGIIDIGRGHSTIYNNIIINTKGNGIYTNDKGHIDSNSYYRAFNNTIVNTGSHGIHFSMAFTNNSNNLLANNIVVNPRRQPFSFSPSRVNASNNSQVNDLDQIKFTDAVNGDYSLKENSPAIDSGMNLSGFGVTFDYEDKIRDINKSPFDQGAYEYKPLLNINAVSSTKKHFKMYPNPASEKIIFDQVSKKIEIIISTITGKKLFQTTLLPLRKDVDISSLDKGIYIISIKDENQFFKLIKQ